MKIFLTASIDERARRRCLELQRNGFAADQAQLRQEIAHRDQMDCERETAPLRQAEDAVSIDTSNLTIEQAVAEIVAVHEKRCRP